jgi:translation elongation factor EF-G
MQKISQELIEKIVEQDEVLMNEYLEGKEIPLESLKKHCSVRQLSQTIFSLCSLVQH